MFLHLLHTELPPLKEKKFSHEEKILVAIEEISFKIFPNLF